MRDKVLRAIARYSMLEPGDKVAVGLSGGADSTALLHVLTTLREEKGIDLLAIHINHGIRGEEAMRDMTFAQELCEKLCVPLTCVMLDIPAEAKRRGIGLEECGRQCRYEQFALLSGERGCKIATAHTLSDSAETMIFNMTRGCGIGGMRGIPAVRGNIIRPLILCSREDIEAYCEQNRLPFVTDSTNADTTYSRNRIRHDVIPSLRRINQSFLSAMERLSHSAVEDDECLRALAAERLSEAQTDGGYIAAKLAALPPALRHRAIIEAISRRTGITPERRHIELLQDCILRGSGAVELSDSFTASVKDGVLCIEPPEKAQERIAWQIPLSVPQAPLPDGRIMHFEVVGRDIYDEKVKNNKYIFKNALDYDIIFRNPVIRNRREGDFFSQAGRGVTKKLKKLLCEAKIPPRSRDALAMIDVSGDIAWLEGFGAAKNYCVKQDTKQILIVNLEDSSSKI